MYKKIIWLTVFVSLMTIWPNGFVGNNSFAEGNEIKKEKVLMIYDYRNQFADYRDSVKTIKEMFGHFNVIIDESSQEDYESGQIENYDYIFVIGLRGKFTNHDMIVELAKTKKTVCWVGKGLDLLLDETGKYNIKHLGSSSNFLTVSYKKNSEELREINYSIPAKIEFEIYGVDSDDVKVYSWLNNGAKEYPYILQDENLIYVSRADLDKTLFFIFSDVLCEILPRKSLDGKKVYITVEDVHPLQNQQKLREIADYLYEKEIPFMVSVTPFFRRQNSNDISSINDVSGFVESLRYMQARGGTMLLNGYMAEISGKDKANEIFDYWNIYEDEPLRKDIDEWIAYTIGEGIELMVENDLYPLGFKAQHYAVSQKGYESLKKYFSTYIGQFQSSDLGFATVSLPFIVSDTEIFNNLLPESLGYIDTGNMESLKEVEKNFKIAQISRDYFTGVFFDSYIDIEYLKKAIEFFDAEDVEFYNMLDENHWVKAKGYLVQCSDGDIFIEKPEVEEEKDKIKTISNNVSLIMIVLLAIALGIFIIILSKASRQTKDIMKG